MVKFKKKLKAKFWRFKANLTLKMKVKVTSFELVRDHYVTNTWFKFENKIQNTSKVIVFTRNHTDKDNADGDDDRTKNNMSPPGRGDIMIHTNHYLFLRETIMWT